MRGQTVQTVWFSNDNFSLDMSRNPISDQCIFTDAIAEKGKKEMPKRGMRKTEKTAS